MKDDEQSSSYCAYCGKYTVDVLSDEHIIPEMLWPNRLVIRVCKPCNDRCGAEVDVLLRRDPGISLAAFNAGGPAPHFRHRTAAAVGPRDDANQVKGFLHVRESKSLGTFSFSVKPHSGEQLGTNWIDEETAAKTRFSPTQKVRVTDEEFSEYVSFVVPDPGEIGLQRPFAKMLLGSLWYRFGEQLRDCPIMTALRTVIWDASWTTDDSDVAATVPVIPAGWLCQWNQPSRQPSPSRPLTIDYQISDPVDFEAFVSLFGKTMRFWCPAHGWTLGSMSVLRE